MKVIKKISLRLILLYTLMISLVSESIIKYIGITWQPTQYRNVVMMQGKTILFFKIFTFILLILIFILTIKCRGIKKNIITFCSFGLIFLGLFWTMIDYDLGIQFFYLHTPPLMLIEIGIIFFIVQDGYISSKLKNICSFLAVFFVVITLFETIEFALQFKTIRMANGKIIEHFANSIFLVGAWNCIIENKKFEKSILFLCSVILIFCSIIITSRGWMLQAIMLMIVCYFSTGNKTYIKKLKNVVSILIIGVVLIFVIKYFMNDSFQFILNRFGQDTRSEQLITFFEQVDLYKLMFGQGVNASYYLNGRNYAFIDNQFLFLSFRYGILSVVCYWLPFALGIFYKNKNKNFENLLSYFSLNIMWILAMSGLCIYYGIKVDVANIYLIMTCVNFVKNKRNC